MRHGSNLDPPNRFERTRLEVDLEQLEPDDEFAEQRLRREIEYYADESQSIVSENDSPDISFRYSVNPYRGCAHACPYCYARNTHEYLGLNAGLDFETRIFVKLQAARLLQSFLARPQWSAEPIVFSGVTDCYQPAEHHFRLTRQCLEVAERWRQPIGMVTKNALVLRDLDLLSRMAERNLIHVSLSITTLDVALARRMEPRTSIPEARLRAVRQLTDAHVPVSVLVAPIIPGLNDHEIPSILQAARDNGAGDARYTLLRLPLTVEPVFREWLARNQPLQSEKIFARVRSMRGGKLNDSRWGQRMAGSGLLAEQIRNLFEVFRVRLGFPGWPPLDTSQFTPPSPSGRQLRLF